MDLTKQMRDLCFSGTYRKKIFRDPGVTSQFRMKRHCQLTSLSDRGDPAIVFGKDFHPRHAEFDLRRTDETHGDLFESGKRSSGVERTQLSAVGVAPDRNTESRQVNDGIIQELLCQEDRPGTSRHDGESIDDPGADFVEHIQFPQKFSLDGAFAAGEDQGIEILFQIAFLPQLECGDLQTLENAFVFGKIPLQSQNCDAHHIPRSSMMTRISAGLIPTMASPSPLESSASIL